MFVSMLSRKNTKITITQIKTSTSTSLIRAERSIKLNRVGLSLYWPIWITQFKKNNRHADNIRCINDTTVIKTKVNAYIVKKSVEWLMFCKLIWGQICNRDSSFY